MRPFFTILLLTVIFCNDGYSQWKCGTEVPRDYREAQQKFMPGYFGCNYINQTNRTISITVHIAEDSLGATGYSLANLDAAIDKLNVDFSPIGVSFEVCEVRNMENFQFDNFDKQEHEDNMIAMYYQVNTINIYLTRVVVRNGQQVGGYAYFPGGPDVIIIDKDYMNQDFDVAVHEMGHFFGLYHTFETDNGVELVDGSNCETSGDLVCDTEADPNEDADNEDYPDCNYNGSPVLDSNGDFYVPPTNNYMSSYSEDCTCRFTPQQYNRMLEQFQQLRSYLW